MGDFAGLGIPWFLGTAFALLSSISFHIAWGQDGCGLGHVSNGECNWYAPGCVLALFVHGEFTTAAECDETCSRLGYGQCSFGGREKFWCKGYIEAEPGDCQPLPNDVEIRWTPCGDKKCGGLGKRCCLTYGEKTPTEVDDWACADNTLSCVSLHGPTCVALGGKQLHESACLWDGKTCDAVWHGEFNQVFIHWRRLSTICNAAVAWAEVGGSYAAIGCKAGTVGCSEASLSGTPNAGPGWKGCFPSGRVYATPTAAKAGAAAAQCYFTDHRTDAECVDAVASHWRMLGCEACAEVYEWFMPQLVACGGAQPTADACTAVEMLSPVPYRLRSSPPLSPPPLSDELEFAAAAGPLRAEAGPRDIYEAPQPGKANTDSDEPASAPEDPGPRAASLAPADAPEETATAGRERKSRRGDWAAAVTVAGGSDTRDDVDPRGATIASSCPASSYVLAVVISVVVAALVAHVVCL